MTENEIRELIRRVRSNRYLMRSETDYITKALEEVSSTVQSAHRKSAGRRWNVRIR